MKKFMINFSASQTAADMHKMIARECAFPLHYGANLDALWDCLSGEMETPAELIISGRDKAEKIPGGEGAAILRLIEEYAAENPDDLKIVYK